MNPLEPLPCSLRQLQYIVAVADLGGFGRAAARTAPSHDAYPQLAIQWREDETSSLVGRIHEGTLDGAIVALDPRVSGLESFEIDRDRSCWPPRRDIPLVRSRRPIAPEALDGTEVLLLEDGHCLRDQALAVCSSAGNTESGYRATSRRRWCGGSARASASRRYRWRSSTALARAIRPFVNPMPGRTLALVWRRRSAPQALEGLGTTLRAVLARQRSARARTPR